MKDQTFPETFKVKDKEQAARYRRDANKTKAKTKTNPQRALLLLISLVSSYQFDLFIL